MTDREFRRLPSLDGYLFELLELGTVLRVERVRRERGELVGELSVTSRLPGIRSVDGTVHVADFNLSSARARSERARILTERAAVEGLDWSGLLEELCQRTIAAERTGEPATLLRELPPDCGLHEALRRDGHALPRPDHSPAASVAPARKALMTGAAAARSGSARGMDGMMTWPRPRSGGTG